MSNLKKCGMCDYETDYLFNGMCLLCNHMYDDSSNENAKVLDVETAFKRIKEEVK